MNMPDCNCKEYPHIVRITGCKLCFPQPDGGQIKTRLLQPGEEETLQVNGHYYLVQREPTN